MGGMFSSWRAQGVDARILLVGLDAAGKTTLLYRTQLEVRTSSPNVSFHIESVSRKNVEITSWDLGGRDPLRPLWRHYFRLQRINALLFIVDSGDRERISEAADELGRLLREDALQNAVCMVLANKQDLPDAMSVTEVTEKLGLQAIKDRPWHIQGSSCTSGDGISEAFNWIEFALKASAHVDPAETLAKG